MRSVAAQVDAFIATLEEQRPGRRIPRLTRPATTPPETIPTGIESIDHLTGGLPRGRITEIHGPESAGRTSILQSTIAEITSRDEYAALIDPAGTFDPTSAEAAGANLQRILWIRSGRNLDRTLKALDMILQSGGFGLVAIHLDDLARAATRRIDLATWFRFQRVIAPTPTILLAIGREPTIRTAAALVLTLKIEGSGFLWSDRLLHGIRPRVEVVRSRTRPEVRPEQSDLFGTQSADALSAVWDMPIPGTLSNLTPSQGVPCP